MIEKSQDLEQIPLEGRIERLIDKLEFALDDCFFETKAAHWNGASSGQIRMFLAKMGRVYVTSCFIPVSIDLKIAFLDQTYSEVEKFFNLNIKIDRQNQVFDCGDVSAVDCFDGTVILIGGSPENNWYHWTLNWFPRLILISKLKPSFFSDPKIYFALHKNTQFEPYRSIIESFGINDNNIIYIDPDDGAAFNDLIIPSFLDQNFCYEELLRASRDHCSNLVAKNDKTFPKKFFISRESFQFPRRRVANFNEFSAVLEVLGIEIVVLDNMSGIDQVNLFKSAELVVGVHGAGLVNIAHCKENCNVIIIENERNISSGIAGLFSGLSDILKLNRKTIVAKEEINLETDYEVFFNLHNRDLIINIDEFVATVQSMSVLKPRANP